MHCIVPTAVIYCQTLEMVIDRLGYLLNLLVVCAYHCLADTYPCWAGKCSSVQYSPCFSLIAAAAGLHQHVQSGQGEDNAEANF